VHCRDDRWIIIDSVQDRDGVAVAAKYLDSIGVAPGCVECIILTHWHEDHVRGATQLASRYTQSLISLPVTLLEDEFQAFLSAYGDIQTGEFKSGVNELIGVCKILAAQKARVRWADANKVLIESGGVRVDTLSPSPNDVTLFLREMKDWAQNIPGVDRIIPDPSRNDASVVTYIGIGETDRILLGGDLEVTGKLSGWQFIHEATWQERKAASLFKIPHHGSENGHYDAVWGELLSDARVAVLAPYGRGRKLPTKSDVERITTLCPASYSASAVNLPKGVRQANSVERTLEEASIQRYRPFAHAGHARFRKKIGAADWNVDLFESACSLDKLEVA
jgi:hypothetical protein